MARTKAEMRDTEDRGGSDTVEVVPDRNQPEEGGQSGDTQGLSGVAESDSESVKELAEEGQYFEAAVVSAIENAPDADAAEIRTREVPEDDVPPEYLERDQD